MATGFVWDDRFLDHDAGDHAFYAPSGGFVAPDRHIENADAKRRQRDLVEASGLLGHLVPIAPAGIDDDVLALFHQRGYIARIRELSAAGGGDAGSVAPFGATGFDVAKLAVGGAVAATEAVIAGDVTNAYVLSRPPGHHAEASRGMGFCIFGNATIAGKVALSHHQLARIAYVDWDVHHGNGTQAGFWDDPRALTISMHQPGAFPARSGGLEEVGEGAGAGYNINIPLPPGSGVGAYQAAMERVVLPALETFKPELIFVASGYDSGAYDPLGRMMLHSDAYRSMMAMVMSAADGLCGGRVVCCHEGGYNQAVAPFDGLAVIEQLAGHRTAVENPFLQPIDDLPGQALQPHQDALIQRAEELLENLSGIVG